MAATMGRAVVCAPCSLCACPGSPQGLLQGVPARALRRRDGPDAGRLPVPPAHAAGELLAQVVTESAWWGRRPGPVLRHARWDRRLRPSAPASFEASSAAARPGTSALLQQQPPSRRDGRALLSGAPPPRRLQHHQERAKAPRCSERSTMIGSASRAEDEGDASLLAEAKVPVQEASSLGKEIDYSSVITQVWKRIFVLSVARSRGVRVGACGGVPVVGCARAGPGAQRRTAPAPARHPCTRMASGTWAPSWRRSPAAALPAPPSACRSCCSSTPQTRAGRTTRWGKWQTRAACVMCPSVASARSGWPGRTMRGR